MCDGVGGGSDTDTDTDDGSSSVWRTYLSLFRVYTTHSSTIYSTNTWMAPLTRTRAHTHAYGTRRAK